MKWTGRCEQTLIVTYHEGFATRGFQATLWSYTRIEVTSKDYWAKMLVDRSSSKNKVVGGIISGISLTLYGIHWWRWHCGFLPDACCFEKPLQIHAIFRLWAAYRGNWLTRRSSAHVLLRRFCSSLLFCCCFWYWSIVIYYWFHLIQFMLYENTVRNFQGVHSEL